MPVLCRSDLHLVASLGNHHYADGSRHVKELIRRYEPAVLVIEDAASTAKTRMDNVRGLNRDINTVRKHYDRREQFLRRYANTEFRRAVLSTVLDSYRLPVHIIEENPENVPSTTIIDKTMARGMLSVFDLLMQGDITRALEAYEHVQQYLYSATIRERVILDGFERLPTDLKGYRIPPKRPIPILTRYGANHLVAFRKLSEERGWNVTIEPDPVLATDQLAMRCCELIGSGTRLSRSELIMLLFNQFYTAERRTRSGSEVFDMLGEDGFLTLLRTGAEVAQIREIFVVGIQAGLDALDRR